jgi:hypothetical protein
LYLVSLYILGSLYSVWPPLPVSHIPGHTLPGLIWASGCFVSLFLFKDFTT